MRNQPVVLLATLAALSGCTAVVNLKVPTAATATTKAAAQVEAADPTKPALTAPAVKPAGAAVVAAAAPVALSIPKNVSVRLTAALIGEHAAGVISNDGGTVISNDGGTVISNDGGTVISNDGGTVISNDGGTVISNDGGTVISNDGGTFKAGKNFRISEYTLAAEQPEWTVANYCHGAIAGYNVVALIVKALLDITNDEENRATLLAGEPITGIFPGPDGKVRTIQLSLKPNPAGESVLEGFILKGDAAADRTQVFRLKFTDENHGNVVIKLPGEVYFASTFDRQKNAATVDAFLADAMDMGKARFHFDIKRPETLGKGKKHVLEVAFSSSQRRTANINYIQEGRILAKAYGFEGDKSTDKIAFPAGSAAAVYERQPFTPADAPFTWFVNSHASPLYQHDFFIGAKGEPFDQEQVPQALLDDVPDAGGTTTGLPAPQPDPNDYNPDADPLFIF